MAQTVQGWAARAATLPGALVHATPGAVSAGADVLEAASRANLLAASGGDMRLSRVRSGKGGALKVSVRMVGAGSNARAEVVPTGPVMLLEADIPRHREPFSYGTGRRYAMAGQTLAGGGTARRRKARRAGFVYVPGLGTFARVTHPGTRGKRPVGRAFDSHHDAAGRAGLDVFSRAIRDHLSS